MDLSETMKSVMSKVPNSSGIVGGGGGMNLLHGDGSGSGNHNTPGMGYVTEKLYMLLQLYIQNKGWNPSVELLQCFSELKDSALLPSAAYLQVIANRLALDSQGRLVLRDSGKIVLPYEHFANAVMLKHMSGPHGLHLSLEATMRAVMESYTIGRENFGMEKEFIIEVVQSCPSAACRYYKTHMNVGSPFMEQSFQQSQLNPEFMGHMPQLNAGNDIASALEATSAKVAQNLSNQSSSQAAKLLKSQQQNLQQQQQQQQQAVAAQQQQQQITAAIIQQQNRAIAQQSLEKFGNLSPLEKQRVLQQFDKKHFEAVQAANIAAAAQAAAANIPLNIPPQEEKSSRSFKKQRSIISSNSVDGNFVGMMPSVAHTPQPAVNIIPNNVVPVVAPPPPSVTPLPMGSSGSNHNMGGGGNNSSPMQISLPAVQQQQPHIPPSPQPQSITSVNNMEQQGPKLSGEYVSRGSLECLESLTASNKDLLALHNGAWGNQDNRNDIVVGQDKIVRAFAELMKNMARMKTFIRPSMCKPYGKQSESLQKTLMDTIQLVQSLRNCLPAPHIPVSSWKSEDRHRKEPETGIIDY